MTATEEITSPTQASPPLSEAAAEGERIYSILESTEDRSVHSSELERAVNDWTTYYHLASQRSLFLRTVRHLIKGRTLEIGAECGALTRFLAEISREVIALEPVAERAEAARLRCSGLGCSGVAKVKILNTSDLGMVPAGPYDVILTRL